jgi:ribosomal protein S18 acetylase RimI-like enzyme
VVEASPTNNTLQGVASKLYSRFSQLAKERKCQVVRVLVPRSRPGAIAFHRAFGFEEIPEEAERIKGFNGADLSVFIRSVDGDGVIVSR